MNNPSDQKFLKALESLNSDQLKAVETIDGPVLLLAGPGTGKTHVLTLRIANILRKTDTSAQSILALTFTEAAAHEMRRRLVTLIGTQAYQVNITTFHSFCQDIIQSNPEYFPQFYSSKVISELEQLHLIRGIINELPLEALKPKLIMDLRVKQIKTYISTLKRESISVEQYKQVLETHKNNAFQPVQKNTALSLNAMAQMTEIALVYDKYDKLLIELKKYDFDDIIFQAVQKIAEDQLLADMLQEQYLYLLVDEYQDTNSAQNKLVFNLTKFWQDQANIFVVGDPHQSIYRFQGASLLNTVEFINWFPNALIISLKKGYRCSQEMYSSAFNIQQASIYKTSINENVPNKLSDALNTKLIGHNFIKESIDFLVGNDRIDSIAKVIFAIRKLNEKGMNYSQMAILIKNNKDAQAIIDALMFAKIPFQSFQSKNALDDPLINELIQYCEFIIALSKNKEDSNLSMKALFSRWLNVDPNLLIILSRFSAKKNLSFWQIIENFDIYKNQLSQHSISNSSFDQLVIQKEIIFRLLHSLFTENGYNWIQQVIEHSGLLSKILKMDSSDECIYSQSLPAIKSLMSHLKQYYENQEQLLNGENLIDYLHTLKAQNLSISIQSQESIHDSVTISTVHKAKGLEWEAVFLMDLVDKKWGNTRKKPFLPFPDNLLANSSSGIDLNHDSDELNSRNEDDRRLFYVAITRALKYLFLVRFSHEMNTEKEKDISPSLFLHELCGENLPTESSFLSIFSSTHENSIQEIHDQLLLKPKPLLSYNLIKDILEESLKSFVLSATSLNRFLNNPRDFLVYDLIKLPTSQTLSQLHGIFVHTALSKLNQALVDCRLIDDKKLIEELILEFRKQANNTITNTEEITRWEKDLKNQLSQYLNNIEYNDGSKIAFVEQQLGTSIKPLYLNDVPIKGRIDLIEWADDEKSSFRIIDYKTGKIKSINDILGKTQSSLNNLSDKEKQLPEQLRGREYRQLLFYLILAEASTNIKFDVTHVALDFVQGPSIKGKRIIREFKISSKEVSLMKELIINSMNEIRSFNFLNKIVSLSGIEV